MAAQHRGYRKKEPASRQRYPDVRCTLLA